LTSPAFAAPKPQPLDAPTKWFYGFGSVAFGVKDNGFSYLLLFFYNSVIGLPATMVSVALLIALVFDACIDPMIGQISDNLRTRWGRRHPFMYAAAVPVALSYLALWNPPHWGQQGVFAYLVVIAIVIRTFVSFYEVPSSALAAEFSSGYDERSVLLSYRYFFGWVGGLALNWIGNRFLFVPDKTHAYGQLNPIGYVHYGMVAAGVMFFAIVVSAAGTHRRIPTLMPPPPRRRLGLAQVLREMFETLSNRSFVFLLASSIFLAMAAGLAASLNYYFNTFFWQFSAKQVSYFTLGVFLSAGAALVVAPRLSKRFGKRPTAMTLYALALTVGLGPVLLRLAGVMPPNHSTALFVIIMCTSVIGTTFGIVASTMGSSMIADVVEVAELKTGRRSEGLLFAASAFIGKAVSGFGILGAGILIDSVHLKAGANPATVPPEVIRQFALTYAPTIIGLYLFAIALMLGYRITRQSHEETLATLAAEAEEIRHPETTLEPQPT
jgi:GPH family glycoside/pentoside/hexuronide:cation symporter